MESKKRCHVLKQSTEDSEFWQKHIAAHAVSGMSKSAYCHTNQVDYARFIYWSRKKSSASSVSSPLVAVKLSSQEDVLAGDIPLCTLLLKSGCRLQVHDACVLPVILERLA